MGKKEDKPRQSGIAFGEAKRNLQASKIIEQLGEKFDDFSIREITDAVLQTARDGEDIPGKEEILKKLFDKTMKEPHIWYVYNHVTQMPMSFVQLENNPNGYVAIHPGYFWIVTEEYKDMVSKEISASPDLELKELLNAEFEDFFQDMFYINGYGGIDFNYIGIQLAREPLVEEKKFDITKDVKDLVKNPIIMNRLISANQYSFATAPLSDLEKTIQMMNISALLDEISKPGTAFILPVLPLDKKTVELVGVDKKYVDDENAQHFTFETIPTKNGREIIPLFTDWKKTANGAQFSACIPRMVTIADVIDRFDVGINLYGPREQSCIITKEIWDSLKKQDMED